MASCDLRSKTVIDRCLCSEVWESSLFGGVLWMGFTCHRVVSNEEREFMGLRFPMVVLTLVSCALALGAGGPGAGIALSAALSDIPASVTSAPADAVASNSQQGLSIVVPEAVHDFGTVSSEEPLAHDFTLQNKGTTRLEIKKVKPA